MEAERSVDVEAQPLARDDLALTHAYWRAANYLSVGQIYLLDNPLLKTPLTFEHKTYITTYGEDMPEIRNWKWSH